MGPRKGGGGKKKGGKKSSGARKRKQWDDYDPREAKRNSGASAITSDDEQERKKPRQEPRGSMFSQWKEKKVAQRKKERQFMSKAEQKKAAQREQLMTQRRRRVDTAYADARQQKKDESESEEANEEEDEDEEDESEGEESDAEQPARARKPRSVFDQFVQAFQPSSLDMESDEEEDEGEEEYEEIEVDEDGNPIEPDDGEEADEEEADRTDDDVEVDGDDNEEMDEPEEEEEEAVDDGSAQDDEDEAANAQDPYRKRFLLGEFSEKDAKALEAAQRKFVALTPQNVDKKILPTEMLEEFHVSFRCGQQLQGNIEEAPLAWMPNKLNVRARLLEAWKQRDLDVDTLYESSPLEYALYKQFSSYTDVFFAGQTYDLTRPLRRLSAMHTLNHVLKSRDTVARNNERLRKRENKKENEEKDAQASTDDDLSADDDKEYRDQGFCRASVLILMPLRSAAAQFVTELLELLPSTVSTFHNKDRFYKEYGAADTEDDEEDGDENAKSQKGDAEDMKEWQRVFSEGNNDDSFQIGISISRRTIKFYSDYRQADIILASPLGLRQQLGDEVVDVAETQTLSSDFLSSIEVCVLDSASLLLMQNIEHLRHIMQALNVKPKEAPNADFSRLREWNLSFLGAYFRQTIVFAHGVEPLLQNLVNKCCKNQSGLIKYVRNYDSNVGESSASITRVVPQIKQIFQRIDLSADRSLSLTAADEVKLRFEYFQKHIFTPLLDNPRRHVLIFVPSYFDYVRIRNLFHDTMNQKLIRAVQCCEYTTSKQVSRARTSFFHGRCHVMLFTERFHFYHQYQMRGIHQIIWYGLPVMGDFYPEMLNMFEDPKAQDNGVSDESKSSIALFTRLDLMRLQRIVGQKRAERMCQSNAKKATFLFC